MNNAQTPSTQNPDIDAAIDTVNELVDTLSLKLFNLGQIMQLAAFAAEARRTLELYSSQAEHFPDFKLHIENCDDFPNNWTCFVDTSAEVLRQAAHQIDACTTELNDGTQCVRDLKSDRMMQGGSI